MAARNVFVLVSRDVRYRFEAEKEDEALNQSSKVLTLLNTNERILKTVVQKSTIASLIFSETEQMEKIQKWNSFWTLEKRTLLNSILVF